MRARTPAAVARRVAVAAMVVVAVVAGAIADAPEAHAADPDPWFGRDKALHFTISAGLASAGYGVTAAIADDRAWRLPVGATVALAAGVGKELYDLTGRGDASWRDLTWDVLGTATGLGVAWLIDHLVHLHLGRRG
jgi:putative lipoprotein